MYSFYYLCIRAQPAGGWTHMDSCCFLGSTNRGDEHVGSRPRGINKVKSKSVFFYVTIKSTCVV